MVLKNGKKNSEFGNIPIDWESISFSDVISVFSSGATPYRGKPKYYNGKVRWITSGELNYNTVYDTEEKISEEAVRDTNLRIHPEGTFLIAITGLEAAGTRGRCGFVGRPSTTNQSCMALYVDPKLLNSKFLYHFYVWQGQNLAFKYCQGTKQQSYTASIAKKLPIILPPLPEQKAIAEVLSDTDNLIQSLEKQIAKKRLIKQGAMQKLLSPKEGWEEKKLGDVLKVRHGKSQHHVIDTSGIYPILGTGGILGYANQYLYNHESVLIGRKGTIDHPQYMNTPFWTVDTLFYTEISKIASPKFLYYKFLMIDWYSYNEASGVPSLNAKTIENIEITIPNKEEQIRIATVISDMDLEIELHVQKVIKYKTLKQGLMQNLLTGKIRL